MIYRDMARKSGRNLIGKYSEGRVRPLSRGNTPGFTLLEVMVSVAILGIGILMVVQLFSGGLLLAGSVRDYTDTVLFAKETMARALIEDELPEGVTSGVSDDGFEWSIEVIPVDGASQSWLQTNSTSGDNSEAKLFDIAVTVYNTETKRSYTLSSVRYEGSSSNDPDA